MTIDLFCDPASAPCRAVLLTATALNVHLNIKLVDLFNRDHLKPEFVKINPQHTIPTIVDDGFALAESRAIITYLVNKYGKGSTLYPEEPQARALVDQRLYFDIKTLYKRFVDYLYPHLMNDGQVDEKWTKFEAALGVFNTFLEGQTYCAGPNLTVADLSLVASVSTIEAANVDITKYVNIKRWYETVERTAPGYQEANAKGLELCRDKLNKFLKKKKSKK